MSAAIPTLWTARVSVIRMAAAPAWWRKPMALVTASKPLALDNRRFRGQLHIHDQRQAPIQLKEERRYFAGQHLAKNRKVFQPKLRDGLFDLCTPLDVALRLLIRKRVGILRVVFEQRKLLIVDRGQF